MILPSLEKGGYTHQTQVNIGTRIGGGRHMADVVANKDGEDIIVSLKWQQTSGTAEQKVPFEAICLIGAVEDQANNAKKAYLVLGGAGWKLRDFYTGGGLDKYINQTELIQIVTLEEFVAIANNSSL
jgi:hypothetical protein